MFVEVSWNRSNKTRVWVVLSVLNLVPWFTPALAQTVTTNITSSGLGTTVTPNGSNTTDITGGTRPGNGNNLFHSFGDFSVGNNHTANFQNETSLPTTNILSRVTGGNVSNIFGTLKTTNFGSAALWLINPAGIVFGPTASLNVGGSVHFSTADYLKFTDGAQFFASLNKQSQLTSVPVAAFGFLGPEPPKAIDVRGATLPVANGETLSLIGGNTDFTDSTTGPAPPGVTISGSTLTAPGGQINLVSVGTPSSPTATTGGELPIENGMAGSPSGFSTMGNLSLQNTNISTTGRGTIFIQGGELVITGSSLLAKGSDGNNFRDAGENGGVISIFGTNHFALTSSTFTAAGGNGGTGGKGGNGGDITVQTESTLSIVDSTLNASGGNGADGKLIGSVFDDAGDLTVGDFTEGKGGLGGNGGTITLRAKSTTLANSTLTATGGTGGNDGADFCPQFECQGSFPQDSIGGGHGGRGGTIILTAMDLTLNGNTPNTLAVDGGNGGGGSGGNQSAIPRGGNGGEGGTLILTTTGTLNAITPATFTTAGGTGGQGATGGVGGAGGSLTLPSNEITLTGSTLMTAGGSGGAGVDRPFGGLTEGGFGGAGGTLTVNGTDLTFLNASLSTEGGMGGTAGSALDGGAGGNGGTRGTLTLAGTRLSLINTTLTSSGGDGGDAIGDGALNYGGNGGNAGEICGNGCTDQAITLFASNLLTLKDSTVTAEGGAGGRVLGEVGSDGGKGNDGGTLALTAAEINLSASTLSSAGGNGSTAPFPPGGGDGGTINLNATDIQILSGTTLIATGGDPGVPTVNVSSGENFGFGGEIKVDANDQLTVTNSIFDTLGKSGNGPASGGEISLSAGDLTIKSSSLSVGDLDLTLEASHLLTLTESNLVALGSLSCNMQGCGSSSGGRIIFTADDMIIENSTLEATAPSGADVGGNGGLIALEANNRINLTKSTLNAKGTDGNMQAGGGGIITIEATTLQLRNPTVTVDAGASSDGVPGPGGGLIQVTAHDAFTMAGGNLSSSTAGENEGGSIIFDVGSFSATEKATFSTSSSGEGLFGSGNFDGPYPPGSAGDIALTSATDIFLTDSAIQTTAAEASGGNIKLTAPGIVLLNNAQITSSVNGPPGSNGGNIGIDPEFVVLANGSQILAQAFGGDGGNINIVTNTFFAELGTLIDASSQLGISGTVTIQSPVQNLSGTIAPLPKNFTNLANLYAQRCAGQKSGQFSSFVQGARDALPPQPGEALGSPMRGEISSMQPAPVSKTREGIPPQALRPDLPEGSGFPASPLLVYRAGCPSS